MERLYLSSTSWSTTLFFESTTLFFVNTKLNPVERFWKHLRRQVTHNHFFPDDGTAHGSSAFLLSADGVFPGSRSSSGRISRINYVGLFSYVTHLCKDDNFEQILLAYPWWLLSIEAQKYSIENSKSQPNKWRREQLYFARGTRTRNTRCGERTTWI